MHEQVTFWEAFKWCGEVFVVVLFIGGLIAFHEWLKFEYPRHGKIK